MIQVWNNCGYDDSSNLLYSTLDETEKKVKRGEKSLAIDVINLFREGIQPAWEDPQNKKGYDMRVELDVTADTKDKKTAAEKIYKDLWQNFVFGLIGEESDYSQHIAGMRWKFQANRTAVRIELWIRHPAPDNLPTKALDARNQQNMAGNPGDESWKVWNGIKKWMEETVKQVRLNVPQITYTGH